MLGRDLPAAAAGANPLGERWAARWPKRSLFAVISIDVQLQGRIQERVVLIEERFGVTASGPGLVSACPPLCVCEWNH